MKNLGTSYADIFPQDACTEAGADWGIDDNLIGTGPYKFVSSVSGSNVVLTRNDEYWGEAPAIKDVTMTIIAEESTAIARMETGEADFMPNVTVEPFDELLVDFAHRMGAQAVVKGLRAITDFEYEFQMTALNYQLDQELETLFIMSTPQHMYLSSSIVREIASLGGDVSKFVSPCVEEALRRRYAELAEAGA